MKPNLKNFPSLKETRWIWSEEAKAYIDRETSETYYMVVREWLESFTKALQDLRAETGSQFIKISAVLGDAV